MFTSEFLTGIFYARRPNSWFIFLNYETHPKRQTHMYSCKSAMGRSQ